MYKLEILEINEEADFKFFSHWLKTNHKPNYIGGAMGGKIVLNFMNQPSTEMQNDIVSFYETLNSDDILEDYEIIKEFEQMKADGQNYFFEAKAKYFGVRYKDGTLSDSNINYCYNRFEKVESRLNNGDWKPALYYLEHEIGTVTQLDMDNGYSQEIHDYIVQDMYNYINNL
jgi:hypothetical protein